MTFFNLYHLQGRRLTDVQAIDTDRRSQTEDLSFFLMEYELGAVPGKILAHRTHHGGIRVEDGIGAHQHIAADKEADPTEADRRAAVADGDIQPHALPTGADTVDRQSGKAEGTDLANNVAARVTDTHTLAGGIALTGHRIAESAPLIGDLIPCVHCRNITL